MSLPPYILAVDDDADMRQLLFDYLSEFGFRIACVPNGKDMREHLAKHVVDLVLLDLKLPAEDGMAIVRELRACSSIPIIMLTGCQDDVDRIMSLELGADDYLTKPFDFGELLARLRAVIRRGQRPLRPSVMQVGPLQLDTRARRAFRRGDALILTAREYALLEHLALHAEEVVGRGSIAEHVWDTSYEAMSNAIDVCIQRLRRKIDDPGQGSLIVTRRGEGYMLSAAGDRSSGT